MPDRQGTCGHVGIVLGSPAAAAFERRCGGQHRQICQWPAGQSGFHVPFLGQRGQTHGPIRRDRREITVQRGSGMSNRLADKLDCLCVGCLDQRQDRGLFGHCGDRGPAGCALGNRVDGGLELGHVPARVVAAQRQVNHADMRSPKPRHHGGRAVQRAPYRVNDRAGGEIAAWKGQMLMSAQNRVDPVNRGQRDRGVFHHRVGRLVGQAGMAQGDDHIGAVCAHMRHIGGGGLKDIAGVQIPL